MFLFSLLILMKLCRSLDYSLQVSKQLFVWPSRNRDGGRRNPRGKCEEFYPLPSFSIYLRHWWRTCWGTRAWGLNKPSLIKSQLSSWFKYWFEHLTWFVKSMQFTWARWADSDRNAKSELTWLDNSLYKSARVKHGTYLSWSKSAQTIWIHSVWFNRSDW